MKVSDLQLGDWVDCFGGSVKVTTIKTAYNNGEDFIVIMSPLKSIEYSFKSEYIKPIPLTTDILTNNGFTQDTIGSGLILHIDNSENLYVLVNYRHNGECRNVEISNKMYNISCPIKYVHELQHALRLCGLSELAENLKVL